ncbi:hypothetical protein ACO1O0_001164 [Amphichorda felina]
MGRTRGRRRLRDDEPEIDLLATTFNLPTRQTVQRNEMRGAQRVTISYESESDEDDDEEKEDGDSSDSLSVSDAYLSSEDEDEEEEESEDDQQELTRPYRGSSRSKHAPLSQPKQPKDQRCLKLNKKAHQPAPKRPTPTPRRTRQPSQQRSRSRHDKRRDSGDVSSLRLDPKTLSIPSSATFPPQAIPHMPYGMMPGSIAPQFSQFPMANPIQPPPPPPQVYNQPRFAFIQAPNPTQASQPAILFGAHHPHSSMGGRQKKASKELTRIQRDLDQKSAALERHPGDFSLEAEVKALQQRLNLTLNEVMGRGRSARTDKSPSEMKSSETKHRSKSVGSKQEDIPEAAHQQDKLPAHQPSRHVCFGCGSIRSRKYHEMHPLAPGKQKFPSLCEGCRDEVHRKDVMDHHCRHVCFGCGIYRSKSFHKKHPAKSGDAILPNYCSRCLMERHAAEEATVVTDASSVMNSCVGTCETNGDVVDSVREQVEEVVGGHDTFHSHIDPGKARSGSHFDSKSGDIVGSECSDGSGSRLADLGDKTARVSSEAPYFPTRSHGASKRRAQRSSSGMNGADQPNSPQGDVRSATQYEPPSIEDDTGSSPRNFASPSRKSSQGVNRGPASVRFSDSHPFGESPPEAEVNEATIRRDGSQKQGRSRMHSSSPLMDSCGRPLSTSERLRMRTSPTGTWNSTHSYEEHEWEAEPTGNTHGEFFGDSDPPPPPAFSRGAFSMDSGFKSHAWDWTKFKSAEENAPRQSPPYWFDQDVRPSPTESGQTPRQSPNENLEDDYPSPPPQHPPRSAFSSFFDDAPKDYGARMSQGPRGSRSTPASPSDRDHAQGSHRAWRAAASSFASATTTAGAFSCFTDSTDGSCSASSANSFFASDSSGASRTPKANPYYTPRARHFSSFQSFHERAGKGEYGGAAEAGYSAWARGVKPGDHVFIPEPIVEEPESAISSPESHALFLEYDVVPVLDLDHSPQEQDPPEVEESSSSSDDGSHRCFEIPDEAKSNASSHHHC